MITALKFPNDAFEQKMYEGRCRPWTIIYVGRNNPPFTVVNAENEYDAREQAKANLKRCMSLPRNLAVQACLPGRMSSKEVGAYARDELGMITI